MINYDGMKIYAGIGSRKTPKFFCDLMTELARELHECGYTLSTGAAEGADQAFMKGTDRIQLWLPYQGSNGYRSPNEILPEAFEMAERLYPWDWDSVGEFGQRAHARNCHIVLGHDLKTPVDFIICWTPNGAMKGGTGQALRVAKVHKIPVLNLGGNIGADDVDNFLSRFV